jgi:hypothetical protein
MERLLVRQDLLEGPVLNSELFIGWCRKEALNNLSFAALVMFALKALLQAEDLDIGLRYLARGH